MFDSVLRRSSEPQTRVGYRALLSLGAHALVLGGVIGFRLRRRARRATLPRSPSTIRTARARPAAQDSVGQPGRSGPHEAEADHEEEGSVQSEREGEDKRHSSDHCRAVRRRQLRLRRRARRTARERHRGRARGRRQPYWDRDRGGRPARRHHLRSAKRTRSSRSGPAWSAPKKLSCSDPVYTRDAREAKVEGKMLVQCVISPPRASSAGARCSRAFRSWTRLCFRPSRAETRSPAHGRGAAGERALHHPLQVQPQQVAAAEPLE